MYEYQLSEAWQYGFDDNSQLGAHQRLFFYEREGEAVDLDLDKVVKILTIFALAGGVLRFLAMARCWHQSPEKIFSGRFFKKIRE
ncbi:hypothetical protein [Lucifera butyrica]|uniref:hypothetical protein n=1 Tax=Lucifera butyrica TaxID=1351585 RepID=UPI0014034BD3|nr:hypothetical protein [Lucifera butyrica]